MGMRLPDPLRRCVSSYQAIGLILGPVAFVITLFLPRAEGLSEVGQGVLATTLWTAIWWMTEAIPINAASFLPFLLFPFLLFPSPPLLICPLFFPLLSRFISFVPFTNPSLQHINISKKKEKLRHSNE